MSVVRIAVRIVLGLLLGAAALVIGAGSSAAQSLDGGTAEVRGDGITGIAFASQGQPGGRFRGDPPPCTFTRMGESREGVYAWRLTYNPQDSWRDWRGEERAGTFWRLECRDPDLDWDDPANDYQLDIIFVPDPDPTAIAELAIDTLGLEAPPVVTNPGLAQRQLVNLETWLWLRPGYWTERSMTVSALWIDVEVSAVPVEARWAMGDGNTVVCRGPGTPYDTSRPAATQSTDCGHTYRRAARGFPAEVTVVWQPSATVEGVPLALGPVERSQGFSVSVTESQAIVVP